jgi:hypothetical protein
LVFEDFIPVALFDWRCEALERDAGARSELLVAQGVALAGGIGVRGTAKSRAGSAGHFGEDARDRLDRCRPHLLYTGVTRGKRLVILLGQKKAVAIAVKNVSGRRRWSKLREWLNPVSLRLA